MRVPVFLFLLSLGSQGLAAGFPWIRCFELAGRQYGIDPALLLAVASVESNWNADARSSANAHGVMQIRWPVTARHLGIRRIAELYNPCLNIHLGARYLNELSTRYRGNRQLMLAAYHYGPSRIRSTRDIPDVVGAYVERVERRLAEIRQEMAVVDGPVSRSVIRSVNSSSRSSGPGIRIIAFRSNHRAGRYLRAMQRQQPEAPLSIRKEGGLSVVYLDTTTLSVSSRYQWNRLLPES